MTTPKDKKYFQIAYNSNTRQYEMVEPSASYTSHEAILQLDQFHKMVYQKEDSGARWKIGDDSMPQFATLNEIEEMNTDTPNHFRRSQGRGSSCALSVCMIASVGMYGCNSSTYNCNGLCGSDECITNLDQWCEIMRSLEGRVQLLLFIRAVKNTEKILPWLPENRMKNFIKMISLDRYEYLMHQIASFI